MTATALRRTTTTFHSKLLVVALVLGVGVGGCRKESVDSRSGSAELPAAEQSPAAPTGLVANVFVAHPQRSWTEARTALGASGRFLPRKFPLVLARLLSASPVLSGRFVPELPTLGAVGQLATTTELGWVLAFRVRSGAELVAELSTGGSAAFRAVRKDGLVVLERASEPAFGVSNNHLLVASDQDALIQFGAYAARIKRNRDLRALGAGQPVAQLELTDFFGALLAQHLSGATDAPLRFLSEQLAQQQEHGPAKHGEPEVLLSQLRRFRVSLVQAAGSLRAGQLELRFDGEAVEWRGRAVMRGVPRPVNDGCRVLSQLPEETSGFLLLSPALGGDFASQWAQLLTPPHSPDREQALRRRLQRVHGPLLFGAAERIPFMSFGFRGDAQQLDRLIGQVKALPLLRRSLPAFLGSEQVAFGNALKAGAAIGRPRQAETALAWRLSEQSAWLAFADGADTWLRENIEPVPQAQRTSVPMDACGADTWLLAMNADQDGATLVRLSSSDAGAGLLFRAPASSVVRELGLLGAEQ